MARALADLGVELLASGGTRSTLIEAGLPAIEVAVHTGQPEILGGRVKTLHPKIHGGILARRDLLEDLEALAAHGFEPIDLVVVNLYPFEQTVARPARVSTKGSKTSTSADRPWSVPPPRIMRMSPS